MRTFLIVFLISLGVIAQNREEAMQKLAAETCSLMKASGLDLDDVDMMDFQMKMGESFNKAYSLETEYYNANGITMSLDNPRDNLDLGIDLGEELVANCPYFKEVTAAAQANMAAKQNPSLAQQLKFIIGKVVEVEKGMFPTLVVENEQGERQEFLWISKVGNTGLLKKAISEGSTIEFEFDMEELYDASTETYKATRVLKSVKQQ
jgi:hypothetical protein